MGLSRLLQNPAAAGLFVVGVGAASVAWQLLVIGLGGFLGGRTTPRARQVTALVGNLVVAGLGVVLIAGTLAT